MILGVKAVEELLAALRAPGGDLGENIYLIEAYEGCWQGQRLNGSRCDEHSNPVTLGFLFG